MTAVVDVYQECCGEVVVTAVVDVYQECCGVVVMVYIKNQDSQGDGVEAGLGRR